MKQIDDKDEKIADALISLGMSHYVARTLCCLRNVVEAGGDNGGQLWGAGIRDVISFRWKGVDSYFDFFDLLGQWMGYKMGEFLGRGRGSGVRRWTQLQSHLA